MGCIQNADPILCPLSAIAFYFFNHWGKDGAKSFPFFQQLEDYYNLYVFPSSIKVPQQLLSYHTQFKWNKKCSKEQKSILKKKTYSTYKQNIWHAKLSNIKETQIKQARHWNINTIIGTYFSYLFCMFMQSIVSFLKESVGFTGGWPIKSILLF